MKKLGVALITGILALTMCACNAKEDVVDGRVSEKLEENVEEILMSVISDERVFITEGNEEVILQDYVNGREDLVEKSYPEPDAYTFVDYDQDGRNEMAIAIDLFDGPLLVLRYNDGNVYGYEFEYSEMALTKVDGSFWVRENAMAIGIGHLVFKDNNVTVAIDAYKDDVDSEYKVGRRSVKKAVVEEHISKWKQKDSVIWTTWDLNKFTEYD